MSPADRIGKYQKQVIAGIGDRIKRCRMALGISKAHLARKAGLTRPTITYYENRDAEPTLTSLRKLADALGVSVDYLIGLEKGPEDPGDFKIQLLFQNVDKLDEQEILLMEKMCDRILEKNIRKGIRRSSR